MENQINTGAALLQPRLVQHLFEGGTLRRWTADGPNEARDNFHELRWMNGRFVVAGFAAAFLSGDACMIEALKHPEEWEAGKWVETHEGYTVPKWVPDSLPNSKLSQPPVRDGDRGPGGTGRVLLERWSGGVAAKWPATGERLTGIASPPLFSVEPTQKTMDHIPRYREIEQKVKASTEGREASREGERLDANPYSEESELHWRWLDAWCVEETAKLRRGSPMNDQAEAPR